MAETAAAAAAATISLIDARTDSLTITWKKIKEAKRYVLEFKKSDEEDDSCWTVLSSKLTTEQAKKKNLVPDCAYYFRVSPLLSNDDDGAIGCWITHDEPFRTLSTTTMTTDDAGRMITEAPKVSATGNQSLLISWNEPTTTAPTTTKYELQMRENNGGETWKTLSSSLSGTEVKKKNLASKSGYQFRVRCRKSSDNDNDPHHRNNPFSPPSDVRVGNFLSEAMKRWFSSLKDGTLVGGGAGGSLVKVSLADALAGKEFVLLYVSAHWCPPCRKYTPLLANWYRTVEAKNATEIVFVSADHDDKSFREYFATSHPWLAIDYENDADARESLQASLRVSGIPRLVVLNAKTGKIVEDNAVGKPLDLNSWRRVA